MAEVQWVGGTHRITDPAAWSPGLPGPGDTGIIGNGTALAVDEMVGPYTLGLIGNVDGTASLATFESNITAPLTNNVQDFGEGSFTVDFVGSNAAGGDDDEFGYPEGATEVFKILDATSPNGVVVQQGVLTNTGDIASGDHYSGRSLIGSDDALLVNNGTFGGVGYIYLGVAVAGTGTLDVSTFDGGRLTVAKAVAASQTVDLTIGQLTLLDPVDFRATIDGFSTTLAEIDMPQQIDAARFVNHVLVLTSGDQIVAELKFSNDVMASDFLVTSSADGTFILKPDLDSGAFGMPPGAEITVASTGTVPAPPPIALPQPIAKLPSSGPDLAFTSGAHVASVEALNGYTIRLEGSAAASAPSLDETSTTFGSSLALRVEGQGTAARFGSLQAVGYNANAGAINAQSGTGGGAATLALDISDVTSPDSAPILAGAFNNTGAISAGAGSTIDITGTADSKLINAGTVTANGMVFIGPTVTGTGTMTVGNHTGTAGSLELGGYVATGQAINLAAGTLTIDDTHHFFATVYDFDARDSIVLKGLDVSNVTYNNGAVLLDGGADGTLHFHRPNGVAFNTGSFVLNHSGTDTIITTPALTR